MNCDTFGLADRLAIDGGSGNPRDVGGDYGWNVEITEQAGHQATLRIWNTRGASAPGVTSVTNAFGGLPSIAPNTWVVIKGSNLAPGTRTWQGADFAGGRMPPALDGVKVSMNESDAFVYYISPSQINVLSPPDLEPGAVKVVIDNNGVESPPVTVTALDYAPTFFVIGATPYVLATHLDGGVVGPVDLYPGYTSPARPGETIVLYANGCGPTSVPIVPGSPVQSGNLYTKPDIRVGSHSATVTFAGLVSPGLYQLNVVLPEDLADGDVAITGSYAGVAMQGGLLLTVRR